MSQIQELTHLQIPLQIIKLATDNFADQNFIGQGGFGRVYKGQLPHPTNGQGTAVAVKRLDVKNMMTGQGQNEFLKEIVTLASYKHDNIVSLIGFCDEDDEKVLVYKHEVNGSLDKHLSDKDLTWEQRLHICLDVARGLKYLHEDVGVGHRVIHRDMKSSNILLDENMKAKISDFGLSKIGPRSEQFSILVTNVAGTLGYVDPQYSETGVLTKESDVYALGIVLCEVLCGRFACIPSYGDRRTFLSLLVTHHYDNRSIDRVIFPCLHKQMKPYSYTFVRIAFDCMNKDRRHRPTMGTVLKELEAALEHQTVLKIGKRTMLWGSTSGGNMWTFMVNNNQKLTNITINYDSWIHSISFTKKDLDGELSCSQTHGGDSRRKGKIYEINFDDDEEIIGISGTIGTHHDHELVSSLCFVTNKREHGPFGTTANTGFSASWDVGLCVGFHGHCGWELDAIGCYLV